MIAALSMLTEVRRELLGSEEWSYDPTKECDLGTGHAR